MRRCGRTGTRRRICKCDKGQRQRARATREKRGRKEERTLKELVEV